MVIFQKNLSAMGVVTKDYLVNNNNIGNTCKLQNSIGDYYKINSISSTGNVKGVLQNNQKRWVDKALKIYIEGAEKIDNSTLSDRGSVTVNIDDMEIKESLGMWCYIPSRYIVENTTRDGISRIATPQITYSFYNNEELIASFDQKPSRFGCWNCGWFLHKFSVKSNGQDIYNNFINKTINKIVISIKTINSSPNFEMYIDSFVADQKIKPIFCYNLDYGFEEDEGLELAHYLYKNNIPVNCRINFATDISSIEYIDIRSMTASELRVANITGEMIALKGYYEGLFDLNVYSNGAFQKKYTAAVNWLKFDESNEFSIASLEKQGNNADNSIIRPVITSANWQHKLDDTLRMAEMEAGFKCIRGYGKETYYVDNITNVINTYPCAQTYSSVDEITDEWIDTQFNIAKDIIDKAVKRGFIFNLFSHKVYPKDRMILQNTRIMPFEFAKKILDYVLELNKNGDIQIMNMDNIYYNSINS